MFALRTLAILVITATFALAAEPPKAINPEAIKDKVSLKLDQEVAVRFEREGNKLLKPTVVKPSDDKPSHITVQLKTTTDSPLPPPREGATRPYLQIENNLEKTLQFRAMARNKGSREFFDITAEFEPIAAGHSGLRCWEFDSRIEEVVLYQFATSDQPAK